MLGKSGGSVAVALNISLLILYVNKIAYIFLCSHKKPAEAGMAGTKKPARGGLGMLGSV